MRRALLKLPSRPLAEASLRHPRHARFMTVDTKNPIPPKPIEPSNEQSQPLGPYYESILNNPQPIPREKPEEPPASSGDDGPPSPPKPRGRKKAEKEEKNASAPTSSSAPKSRTTAPLPQSPPTPAPTLSSATPAQQARVIFGSRLLGPAERAERLESIKAQSSLVAGVLVPPKPEEPDNCCMSGCVNCVWDRYRDELEGWALASKEAERRLRGQEAGIAAGLASSTVGGKAAGVSGQVGGAVQPSLSVGGSMDDDGGGSAANWDVALGNGKVTSGTGLARDFWDEELYRNVPVGIREFMKQEKRLKEKHMREGTSGG
jgi:hypothetical protein